MTAPVPTPPQSAPNQDWLTQELTQVRQEAAGRRVENNTLKTELATATSQVQALNTEKTDAEKRAAKAEADLLKLNVAIEAGIPGGDIADFVDLLQGSTKDELKASADKALKFYNPQAANQPAFDPSQGRGGNPQNVPDTAEAQFLQWFANVQGTPLN